MCWRLSISLLVGLNLSYLVSNGSNSESLWSASNSMHQQQKQAAARQSSKVVSWPNYVLVAPFRVALQTYSVAPLGVARPKGPATTVEFCARRATPGGATSLLCRAIGSGATKGTCHATKWKMQSLLGLGAQWCGRGDLSRQWCWRDRSPLSRHCVPKPSKDCIFHLVAWQVPLVAPLPMARQSRHVAPPGVARQAQNSAS